PARSTLFPYTTLFRSEKFATFLESNRLGTEEEAVYKRAVQQFPGTNWYHKLARWYLAKKRAQDLQGLSQQVLQIFSGSDLESYLDRKSTRLNSSHRTI